MCPKDHTIGESLTRVKQEPMKVDQLHSKNLKVNWFSFFLKRLTFLTAFVCVFFLLVVAPILCWSSSGKIDKRGEREWITNHVLTSGKRTSEHESCSKHTLTFYVVVLDFLDTYWVTVLCSCYLDVIWEKELWDNPKTSSWTRSLWFMLCCTFDSKPSRKQLF